ncbi:MAG TPA: hypothetical protein VHI54_10065 [Actinomycetota bacterium]|nr:hypothetical protein [Actinomycetota bacterium]
MTGLITQIARGADGKMQRFTLRQGAESFDIQIDSRRDYGFDLEHLEQHRISDWPVTVRLEQRDGVLFAVEILDAPSPTAG